MPSQDRVRSEEFLHLVHLEHDSALLSWARFFFNDSGSKVYDESDRAKRGLPTELVGRNAIRSYEEVTVSWWPEHSDEAGERVERQTTHNHLWLDNLRPDTRYRYEVRSVKTGHVWGSALHDWSARRDKLVASSHSYNNVFHTFPRPNDELTRNASFVALGDFGRGVQKRNSAQAKVARALLRTVESVNVRFVITTGDNVYSGGARDEDWYFKFYEPYRFIINRVPVYPSMGNHDGPSDSSDADSGDDRAQLYDNFFLLDRFDSVAAREALNYTFKFGRQLEFVALDTTEDDDDSDSDSDSDSEEAIRHILTGEGRQFLDDTFVRRRDDLRAVFGKSIFRVPFFHHPPYCAGPKYHNNRDLKTVARAYFEPDPSVALVLNGHEHNYQHAFRNGVNYVVTGGGGEARRGRIRRKYIRKAHTRAYRNRPHFCLLRYRPHEHALDVTPVADDGRPLRVIHIVRPKRRVENAQASSTVVVTRKRTADV